MNKDEVLVSTASIVTSVAPTDSARVRLRPIDGRGVVIRDGLLADRQRLNREVTLLRGAEELERAGTLDNLRIAAGRASGERRGMVFSDSDVYKWLEALAWELGREPSAELERLSRETTELVAAAQEPDGYLNSRCHVLDPAWRWTDLEMGHELYCAGHLFQAGVASARATGDTTLLTVACRFADLIDEVFGEDTDTRTDGHPEVEVALVELYRHTGRAALPPAGRHAHRAAGIRDLRRRPVRPRLLPGRRAGSRRALDRRTCRARPLPRGRRRRHLRRDRRRGAARVDAPPVGRPDLVEDLSDRRRRLAPPWRGDRRPVRAAARPRLLRDLRGDRAASCGTGACCSSRARAASPIFSSERSTTASSRGFRSTASRSST